MEALTDIVGHHVHLVKFDTVVSDGAANGWNNIAGARRYETLIERFFANTGLRTVFFHDHLFANSHQMHGMFGAMIIEEAGTTFHSVRSGRELKRGTQAVIRRRDGNPLNPPLILETCPGDEIIIRLLDGAHEEQHAFNLTGLSWRREIADPHSPLAASQTIGFSEAFNLRITQKYAPGDYLYYFGGIDDAWLGLWGILRANAGEWIEVTLHNLFDPEHPWNILIIPRSLWTLSTSLLCGYP